MHSNWLIAMLLVATGVAGAAEPDFPPMQWRAVPAEELAMTEEPGAPGASAVYLYTELNQRPERNTEQIYRQIKVLKIDGRGYANIAVGFRPAIDSLSEIEARVIQPDGTIIPFKGESLDRELASGQGYIGKARSLYARMLALPDVRVGSIIEFRFTITYGPTHPSDFAWVLNQDLFTRLARFSNRPTPGMPLRLYVPRGWPRGATPAKLEAGVVRMEARNLPAFVAEDLMPPASGLVQRVEFLYTDSDQRPAEYWSELFKETHAQNEIFLKPSSALRKTATGLIESTDSDEQKARKIYAHVQRISNTAYEGPLDAKERARRTPFFARNFKLADVGTQGYASGDDMVLYCVGLLRAAGLSAQLVLVGGRADGFFDREAMRPRNLNVKLASVRIDGRDVLLDPSIPYLPFGSLSWFHTATSAAKLDSNGGQWIETPAPKSTDATTRREARLKLSADGVLDGTVTVTHTGHHALGLRMELRNVDVAIRTRLLEAELLAALPGSAEVKLLEQPDWNGIGTPFQVKYQMTLRDWVVNSDTRLLVGLGLFGARDSQLFIEEKRRHPIYFGYPYEVRDELRIEYPAGYHLENPPAAATSSVEPLLHFDATFEREEGVFVLRRALTVGVLMVPATNYPGIRSFFQAVRDGDQRQVALAR